MGSIRVIYRNLVYLVQTAIDYHSDGGKRSRIGWSSRLVSLTKYLADLDEELRATAELLGLLPWTSTSSKRLHYFSSAARNFLLAHQRWSDMVHQISSSATKILDTARPHSLELLAALMNEQNTAIITETLIYAITYSDQHQCPRLLAAAWRYWSRFVLTSSAPYRLALVQAAR